MGILKRAADLAYTIRFLTLLVTPWEKSEAFKLGLIDDRGKRQRKAETSEEKSAMTAFHKLVYNIKRLIPGGKIGSYASALYLIKENYQISEKNIEKALRKQGVDTSDILAESTWFTLDNGSLTPRTYRLQEDKEEYNKGDWVRADDNCMPVGDVFGINIFKLKHVRSNQDVFVTSGELGL